MSNKQRNKEIGDLGERIACKFLESKGFKVVERNFWRKWGEIDIVARETLKIVHFVEVKAVSYETSDLMEWSVTHETWRPEELVHQFKLGQIRKAAETWLAENQWGGDFQIDIVAVRMVPSEKRALIKHITGVIAEE